MTEETGLSYEEVREFASSWVERWNAHDADGVLTMVTEDVRWEDPSLERPAQGHGESRAYILSLFRAFPDIAWSMPAALCLSPMNGSGTTLIAQPWACHGTALGPIDPPGFAPTRKRFELEGVDLWEWRHDEGRLSRVTSHYDALEFARRIELMPARGSKAERMMVGLQRAKERFRR
jgi:hypothetical protein